MTRLIPYVSGICHELPRTYATPLNALLCVSGQTHFHSHKKKQTMYSSNHTPTLPTLTAYNSLSMKRAVYQKLSHTKSEQGTGEDHQAAVSHQQL